MQFEWDDNKNQKNVEKHGIDFVTASEAFNDPNKIITFNRIIGGEMRLQVVGQIEEIVIIMMVFTMRNGKNRIISARPANKEEGSTYYEQNDE